MGSIAEVDRPVVIAPLGPVKADFGVRGRRGGESGPFGTIYFLIALGLAGRSRFSLWVGVVIPALGISAGIDRYLSPSPVDLGLVNVAINLLVVILCGYTLFRTRHSDME